MTFKSLSSACFHLGYEIFLPLSPLDDWINGVTSIFSWDFAGSRVIKTIESKPIKKYVDQGSVTINCDSPVWKNKPRCS